MDSTRLSTAFMQTPFLNFGTCSSSLLQFCGAAVTGDSRDRVERLLTIYNQPGPMATSRPPFFMAAPTPIDLLQQNSLAMLVQRELERRIHAGELKPGSKLNEAELAGALGVSRGPVREAFRALDQSGLV